MIEIVITRIKNKNKNINNLENIEDESSFVSSYNIDNKKEYLFNIYGTFLTFLQKYKIIIILLIILFRLYTI
jgi:hypothetical protein